MNLRQINLYHISMKLRNPFVTHAGAVNDRDVILLEVEDNDGRTGWGECVPFLTPFYTAETIETAWIMINDLFGPLLKQSRPATPSDFAQECQYYHGHFMAKAAIEGALWDLYAKQKQMSLSKLIGGKKNKIESGVVISLGENLLERLNEYRQKGYKRYKLKVTKGNERKQLEEFKSIAPDLPVMFDGNGMYKEHDIEYLKSLDNLGLLMIEQPFILGDFFLHQQLQQSMKTSICLDESIESLHDAKQAIHYKSGSTFNIKIGRVGGLTEAIQIHQLCEQHEIPLWCGGMLETGIGRAHNIALASLPQFTLPGDISESKRYWERDIVTPEIKVVNGEVEVPTDIGIGFEVDKEYIKHLTKRTSVIHF